MLGMDIKYFVIVVFTYILLSSCNEVPLRKDFFYNSKLNKCIEIELDTNYILVDHDSSDLKTSFGIELVYNHYKNIRLRIAYPIMFSEALNSDSTSTFTDEWLQNYCKELHENIMINEIYFCKVPNINNVNYLTFGFSEHPKHQGYNIHFESYTVDLNTPQVFIISTVCYNEKMNWQMVKKMHFDLLENLSIVSDCKK